MVEFPAPPSAADLDHLRAGGATVLGPVSDRALIVSAPARFVTPEKVVWAGSLAPAHKISPLIHASLVQTAHREETACFVVEFYADVDMGNARSLVIESGLLVIDNPDLLPNHLLVQGMAGDVMALAAWDEVEYVFPASDDLVQGVSVNSCVGALTSAGPVSMGVPTVGDGWDGPGLQAAQLEYAFASMTDKIPADNAKSEIVRAFSEWAKYAALKFTQTANTVSPRTLTVLFTTGAHGDPYPFQGSGILAHTFYPFPPNPEPIAGDLHFNADENWHIGANTDLFSAALHETGHALGLGHSDNPGDVMYPYYKRVSGLSDGDRAAILELYAAQDTGPAAPPVQPLSIDVTSPYTFVNTASVALEGTAKGGSGDVRVNWTNGSLSGLAQGSIAWSASIPLSPGANTILITAIDGRNESASVTVVVTRQAAPPPSPPTIQILQPTALDHFSTATNSVSLGGTASDSSGIERVTWINSNGGSGQAAGSTSWSTGPIPLRPGKNIITVSACAKSGANGSRTVAVTFAPPAPVNDTTPPTLTILSPPSTNVHTSAAAIVLSGTASDNTGVMSVTWSSSTSGSGTATGTTNWTTSAIPLLVGSNLITIRAADAAGNIAWRSVMVTRTQ